MFSNIFFNKIYVNALIYQVLGTTPNTKELLKNIIKLIFICICFERTRILIIINKIIVNKYFKKSKF